MSFYDNKSDIADILEDETAESKIAMTPRHKDAHWDSRVLIEAVLLNAVDLRRAANFPL